MSHDNSNGPYQCNKPYVPSLVTCEAVMPYHIPALYLMLLKLEASHIFTGACVTVCQWLEVPGNFHSLECIRSLLQFFS